VRSLRALAHMRSNVPGLSIPDEVDRRLRGVPPDRVTDEGLAMCAETIQQVLQIPGVSGVHVMAPAFEQGIPGILDRAGIGRRAQPEPASVGTGGSDGAASTGGSGAPPCTLTCARSGGCAASARWTFRRTRPALHRAR
jgi:methylenetetrahydrofolate reductase (NADH)